LVFWGEGDAFCARADLKRVAPRDDIAGAEHHEPIADGMPSRIAPGATYFQNATNGYVKKVTIERAWPHPSEGIDTYQHDS